MPDINSLNQAGEAPIVIAFERRNPRIVEALQAAGAQLPEHLQQETQALINKAQSVHTVSVHVSVSKSAERLMAYYGEENIPEALEALKAWVKFECNQDVYSKRMIKWLEEDATLTLEKRWEVICQKWPDERKTEIEALQSKEEKCEKVIAYLRQDTQEEEKKIRYFQHAADWITTIDFTDNRSQVTLQEALALVWIGVHDPKEKSAGNMEDRGKAL